MNTEIGLKMREKIQDLFSASMSTGNLRLFSNDYTPAGNSVLTDFVEANFDGYIPTSDNGGHIKGIDSFTGDLLVRMDGVTNYQAATITIAQTIHGWFYTGGNPTIMICAKRFDVPIVVSQSGQLISIAVPEMRVPQNVLAPDVVEE